MTESQQRSRLGDGRGRGADGDTFFAPLPRQHPGPMQHLLDVAAASVQWDAGPCCLKHEDKAAVAPAGIKIIA